MKGFVHNRNLDVGETRQSSAPDGKQNFEDFKAPVLKTSGGRIQQARANGHHSNKLPRGHVDSQAAQDDSAGQRPFYETDAESMAVSSPTASAKHGDTSVTQDPQNAHPSDHADREASESGDGSDSSSDDEEPDGEVDHEGVNDVRPSGLGGPLPPTLHRLMTQIDSQRGHGLPAAGAALPYVKGDSYPETTSGRPSVADSTELKASDNHVQRQTQANPMRTRITGLTTHDKPQNRQAVPRPDHSLNTIPTGLYAQQMRQSQGILEHQAINSSTVRPNQSQMAIRPNGKVNQQKSTELAATNPTVSSNTAHRATAPPTEKYPSGALSQDHGKSQAVNGETEPRESKPHKKGSKKTHSEKQQVINAPVEHDQILDADVGTQSNHQGDSQIQQGKVEPEESSLDYDPDALSRMDFDQLKKQPFDYDPNAREFELPAGQPNGDINAKLGAVAALEQNDQTTFFNSLPIDEWEQAGDWFITQFSDVLNKLKANRQEKRKAAQTFESEIEKRHAAVSKKRKQIENQVNGMKESGENVLKPTPKKTKMKTK